MSNPAAITAAQPNSSLRTSIVPSRSRRKDIIFVESDGRALMVENLPTFARSLPDCGSASAPVSLKQYIRQEVGISTEFAQCMLRALPTKIGCQFRKLCAEVAQDEVAAVSPTRCANLPIVGSHHRVEFVDRFSELRSMKDRLHRDKLLQRRYQLWGCVRERQSVLHSLNLRSSHHSVNDESSTPPVASTLSLTKSERSSANFQVERCVISSTKFKRDFGPCACLPPRIPSSARDHASGLSCAPSPHRAKTARTGTPILRQARSSALASPPSGLRFPSSTDPP